MLIVTALMVAGCGPAAPTGSHPPRFANSQTVPAPTGLAAVAGRVSVTLHWTAGTGMPSIGTFEITRDGSEVGTVGSTQTSFADKGVAPGAHLYRVTAWEGTIPSTAVSVTATVATPPNSDARVSGTFVVTPTVRSSYGFASLPVQSSEWSFAPSCPAGPCSITLTAPGDTQFSFTLTRNGATYSGTYRGVYNGRCGGTPATSTVQVTLTVSMAAIKGGDWSATALTGTLVERSAAQLGCVATGATFALGLQEV